MTTKLYTDVDLTEPNYAAELALIGVTGALHYAPYGTPLALNMAQYEKPHVDFGWISEDGLTESLSEDKNDWTPWQSLDALRSQISKREVTFKVVVWSIGGLANALFYAVPEEDMAYDASTGITSFEQGQNIPDKYNFVLSIDILDGQKARRFIMPNCEVVERGDIKYGRGDLVGYEFTFKAAYDKESGYSIRREFREGWKPGTAGTALAGTAKVKSLGDWSGNANEKAGDGKTYLFSLKGATGGVFKITVGSAVVDGNGVKITDEKLQAELRKAGESKAMVSGSISTGFVVSGVSAKPVLDITKLEGVSTAEVTEIP
ncbi:phage tail protein [Corynebacterium durum]|jgi:hypothetical protein|uniref:phage tail tube protein n=1 Tax=Corynebacterium durum TaxID=61592 RepID=UPI0015CCF9C6|nr:phage tail protein [Corynebacterium durum]MDO4653373.1 phage tail protein [Corynebacterium durum]NYI75336.1 hypothetical protein [Corynebacterium durum]WJY84467.1 hypothetical protein CDUR_03560 [Corynebacterium durum]DAS22096.1 MAG TPA: tail protein [Caudoviricetes sp.]